MNEETKRSLPLGLGMALAQNLEAMNHFASLAAEEQRKIIENAKRVDSKEEMQSYVQQISDNPKGLY